ncbi:MAG TPA: glycosyl hydrolase, partial [Chloroflexota bacterium]|nr:glycosyl hydrolase [Chloroflexota bacterium]
YWLIGNEPNVDGQDNVSADYYSGELAYYFSTIKGADSTAKIVGPNILNWNQICNNSCDGFQSGHSWVDGFRAAWAAGHLGAEPPFDVWALHAYQIDWYHLPMTDPAQQEGDIGAMSAYLGAIPASASKPIWLSEFGVLWAYDGFNYMPNGSCQAGTNCIGPIGPYDQAAVTSWMNSFDGWLAANAATKRMQRWFLYTSFGLPEPYATVYGGVSVVTSINPGAPLSPSGEIYRQQSLMPVP